MIYDCFIFNSELDLLELRLEFLAPHVDIFILVESPQTLSGLSKPLYYEENKQRFSKFSHKIKHVVCPQKNTENAWQYEYFQRDFIRTALKNCNDEDIILISDVDEIVNISLITENYDINRPYLIELPIYYYFLNLKGESKFCSNLLSPYQNIKNLDLGNRDNYNRITDEIINNTDLKTGWHFSYLFGKDLSSYQKKITSFSHQEYNTAYYLNPKRIRLCVDLGIDLFERKFLKYSLVDPKDTFSEELNKVIENNNILHQYIGKRISLLKILLNGQYLNYYLRFKFIPFLNHHLKLNILVKKVLKLNKFLS